MQALGAPAERTEDLTQGPTGPSPIARSPRAGYCRGSLLFRFAPMSPTRSFQAVAAYRPEQIWSARRSFFDEGRAPHGLVSDAVLRSWQRCQSLGRRPDEAIDFCQLDRPALGTLLERHAMLLSAARPAVETLAGAVADAGYAVMLTDASGVVLLAEGAAPSQNVFFRRAFRPGVDVSEQAIGSSAMSVALAENQAVRIFGPEHFLSATQIFHCCAVPVFDPCGRIVATVDISRDMPGMLESSLWLAQRCANRIERGLFESRPAFLHVELDLAQGLDGGGSGGSQALLAIGEDGELMAISRSARQLMSLAAEVDGIHFDDVFEGGFQHWMDQALAAPERLALRLRGGIQLRARVLNGAAGRRQRAFGAMGAMGAMASMGTLGDATDTPAGGPWPANVTANVSAKVTALELGDADLGQTFALASRAYAADLPVLITGETGCGKDVVAQALHAHSHRLRHNPKSPFVAVNCAGLPAELLAGEMFGHVDGAFTGSRKGGACGKVEAAHGGTLFLDEIGDMPLGVQATLLRVLDSREVVRLGAAQSRKVDVRIVSATHQDLRALVAQGRFREDLYYRLAGYEFHIKPLRERSAFDALLQALLADMACPLGRLDTEARAWLAAQPWPGNVRQLRQVLKRVLALAEPQGAVSVAALRQAMPEAGVGGALAPNAVPNLMQKAQDEAIEAALVRCEGNVTAAAKLLGIGRATLYRRLGAKAA